MNGSQAYAAAERYLLSTIDETLSRHVSYKLDRIRALLAQLGDPQRAYPSVHVGGTSGKGSTSSMIAAALQASGKRTGLHTKPHLRSMTERMLVDGVAPEGERFAALLDEAMPAIERTALEFGRPSYYETLLALSLLHFARARVDVAVVEVGLGGRLDGTNVLEPRVAAITSVGYDHTEILGETLAEIAREKAGIAKPGVPLVTPVTLPEAYEAIEAVAAQAGAPLVRVGEVARVVSHELAEGRQRFTVVTACARYEIATPALGAFQRDNAATAIAVLELLGDDLRPAPAAVERAFATLAIPGRMELMAGHPPVVFDIAHNVEKAEHLVAALRERFPGARFHYVVAIGESKDARAILEALASVPSTFTFTTFSAAGRRAVRPQRLSVIAESAGAWGRAIEDPGEALAVARRTAGIGDVVVVTGSTLVVGDLRARWMAERAEPVGR
ncbi:MAG TPA: folylpolyglutamate synthase/dihydrofolate synthase family protein [Verrucomicrobiae bacterium]|nr:folylpolyglutamate synthase/dihydrofolate synthase family protein [Verrucomicrobiae bacterium]